MILTNGLCTNQNQPLNESHKILWDFEIKMDCLILARRPEIVLIDKKKKRIFFSFSSFNVPADHKVNTKENEKIDKHLNIARKRKKKKKVEDMRLIAILILIGAFGTVLKSLEKRLEELEIWGRIATI